MIPDRTVKLRRRRACVDVSSAVLAASDPIDRVAWGRLIAPRAHIRIANRPPAVGRISVLLELDWLWLRTTALGRGFSEIWPSQNGDAVLLELDLTPILEGPALPIAVVLRDFATAGTVRDLRFYLDALPLTRRLSAPILP